MRASGLVLTSPDRAQAGQELHSCVVAILASKLHWEPSKQTIAGMELKYAFRKLGITDDSVLMHFSEPFFYRPFLPLDEESLNKCVDKDTELLETSFNPYTIVLICKIAKVLAVAAKESTKCFLSPTAMFESLTTWADAMQNPLMNDAGSSSGQTSVGNGGSGCNQRVSSTRELKM